MNDGQNPDTVMTIQDQPIIDNDDTKTFGIASGFQNMQVREPAVNNIPYNTIQPAQNVYSEADRQEIEKNARIEAMNALRLGIPLQPAPKKSKNKAKPAAPVQAPSLQAQPQAQQQAEQAQQQSDEDNDEVIEVKNNQDIAAIELLGAKYADGSIQSLLQQDAKIYEDAKKTMSTPQDTYKGMFMEEERYLARNIASINAQIRDAETVRHKMFKRIQLLLIKYYVATASIGHLKEVLKLAELLQSCSYKKKDAVQAKEKASYGKIQAEIKQKKQERKNEVESFKTRPLLDFR